MRAAFNIDTNNPGEKLYTAHYFKEDVWNVKCEEERDGTRMCIAKQISRDHARLASTHRGGSDGGCGVWDFTNKQFCELAQTSRAGCQWSSLAPKKWRALLKSQKYGALNWFFFFLLCKMQAATLTFTSHFGLQSLVFISLSYLIYFMYVCMLGICRICMRTCTHTRKEI